MAKVAILVPRRAGRPDRDRLWSFVRAWWARDFPDWPIVEGHHDAGPFNRSAALNRAAALAGDWTVAVLIDSDVLADPGAVEEAVDHALRTGGPASGFTGRKNLTAKGTERILAGHRGTWEPYVGSRHPDCNSGALAVRRDLWDDVGGYDELFRGWGFEDTAFEHALSTISGLELWKAKADLWHLYHGRSAEQDSRLPGFRANRARKDRYAAARGDVAAMRELLEEASSGAAPLPAGRPTTIPRILHRTVPAETTAEVEGWWTRFGDLHPGWELRTWREPLDPAEFETGDLWPRCTSGAQRAGLIRLEVLHRFGGIYVDSDVEPYRSLEPLLALEAFAGWEDRKVVPDAVLGARAGHPAFAVMLELARREVLAGRGAWASGPGVTTAILPGRADVVLFPPGTFYPYHYTEKDRRREDHATAQPWAFAAHHWAHSWRGT